MAIEKVWLIPVLGFITGVVSLFVPYAIGASIGDIDAVWPYISDGGAKPPESCIFGQLLNTFALFLALCMYLRHRQIVTFYWHLLKRDGRLWRRLSLGLLLMGWVAAFGTSMVANFQETSVISVHWASAIIAFGLGTVYIWAQTVYSYIMRPRMHTTLLCHVRLAICTLATAAGIQMFVASRVLSAQKADAAKHIGTTTTTAMSTTTRAKYPSHYTPGDVGYEAHLAVTTGEWLLVLFFMLYMLTYAYELRLTVLHAPKLALKRRTLTKFEPHVYCVSGLENPIGNNAPNGASSNPTLELEPYDLRV